MESFIYDAILEHMMQHNPLSTKQHGFIIGRSTVTQLLPFPDKFFKIAAKDDGPRLSGGYWQAGRLDGILAAEVSPGKIPCSVSREGGKHTIHPSIPNMSSCIWVSADGRWAATCCHVNNAARGLLCWQVFGQLLINNAQVLSLFLCPKQQQQH